MIYFMRAQAGGPIKIGCSGQLRSRRRQLSSDHAAPFRILAVMPGDFAEERAVHRRFAASRAVLGRQREWFDDTPELRAFIAEHGRPYDPVRDGFGPVGAAAFDHLCRLGLVERKVPVGEVARIVTERTGVRLSPGSLSRMLGSVRVSRAKIEHLAKGLGVKPAELTRKPKR